MLEHILFIFIVVILIFVYINRGVRGAADGSGYRPQTAPGGGGNPQVRAEATGQELRTKLHPQGK